MSVSRSNEGKCFLVGAGPGDLGLVTLRAKELLEHADVIVYDALANPEMLGWAPVDTKIIFVGKRAGEKTLSQDEINALLIEKSRSGKKLPVALIRLGTGGQQRTIVGTLENIAERASAAGFEAPAVAIFGDVVSLRKDLNWFEKRPLFGKRIVVTRTRKQASELSSELRALGADVIQLPTIRIEPPSDLREFAELVQAAHSYDWIVFTSPNGVDAFFEIFFKLYDDAREIGAAKIAAIGPTTAQRVKDLHLHVDLQTGAFVAEAVVKEFEKTGGVENLRILIARAETARDLLPKRLGGMGAIVDEAFAYQTVPETRDVTGAHRRFSTEGADLITFTSSSTVENILA